MIRYFCDYCGAEIPLLDSKLRNPPHRLTATIERGNSRLVVEVMEYKDGTANDGVFCRYCVLDALQKLDDRPVRNPPL